MGFRKTLKGDDATETGIGGTTPETPETAAADAVAVIAETPAAEPIPDPIVAVDDDGNERPMSGGSFIRLEDGTLIRNPEA